MSLEFILVAIFSALCFFLLSQTAVVQKHKISYALLAGVFGLKVLIGFLYGWIHLYFYGGVDTWFYFEASKMIYDQLWQDPRSFLQLVFLPNNPNPPEHLKNIAYDVDVWADEPRYIMLRINALIHLISGGYYSVHVVIWNLFSTLGLLWIYDAFADRFPDRKMLFFAALVLTPGLLFWGSGMHKAAVCFFCFGGLLWSSRQFIHKNRPVFHIFLWISCAILLFLLRQHAVLLIFPALVAYFWARSQRQNQLLKFTAIYSSGLAVLALLSQLSDQLNFFARIAEVRQQFIAHYHGYSDLQMPPMEPNFWGMISNLPAAIYNTLMRPHFLDVHRYLAIPAVIETLIVLLLILYALLRFRPSTSRQSAFVYACIFYALSYFILIGLTVDNLGAIVRYRAVPLVLLIPALLAAIKLPNTQTKNADS